jgi:hypothetical protein
MPEIKHSICSYREDIVGVPVWIGMRSFGQGLVYIWSDETPLDYLPKIERYSQPLDSMVNIPGKGNCHINFFPILNGIK